MSTAKLMFERGLFKGYDPGGFYDEMFADGGLPRPHCAKLFRKLAAMESQQFEERRKLADLAFLLQGITFTVYSDGRGTEREVAQGSATSSQPCSLNGRSYWLIWYPLGRSG